MYARLCGLVEHKYIDIVWANKFTRCMPRQHNALVDEDN